MTLRQLIFWPHLVAGLIAGLVILTMSVTGVLLTYERQMIAWSDSQYRSTPSAPGARRLSVDRLIDALRLDRPGSTPTSVTIGAGPEDPVVFGVGQQVVYADAYTGRVLGDGSWLIRRVMTELRSWHRWLAVDGENRTVARAITGWANVVFAILALSGLYLWFPRRWTWPQIRPVMLFNLRARGRARDFNWHNVIGAWSLIPLLIVVVSAVPISFQWANAAVYRLVGEMPPAGRTTGPADRGERRSAATPDAAGARGVPATAARGTDPQPALEPLLARAEQHVAGWRTIALRVPQSADAPVVFTVDRGTGGQPHLRSTLTLDRAGLVQRDEPFSSQTPGRRIRSIMRFAHTGEVLGVFGQTVAGVASLGGVVLVWTGCALALRRFRNWIARRPRSVSRESARSTAA